MKVKLKDKNNKLPSCWKECGCSFEDWKKLQDGKSVEVSNLNNLEYLFNVDSLKPKKEDK
tara:strand:+ start:506 stop:685 length:180 start_codon:yes stop_codon:yes gene_type:complete